MNAHQIAIEVRPGEVRAAALDDTGAPFIFEIERAHQRDVVGDVLLGRVTSVRWDLGHIFVDVGHAQHGLLNVPAGSETAGMTDVRGTPIREGAAIVVQVNRAPEAEKGARLTLRIDLQGAYMVATPGRSSVSISRKIDNPAWAENLRGALSDDTDGVGFSVRTVASSIAQDVLLQEAAGLRTTWSEIVARASETGTPVPSILRAAPGLIQHICWHWVGPDTRRIVTDDAAYARKIADVAAFGDDGPSVDILSEPMSAFASLEIDAAFDAQFESVIALPSGGRVIIQETAALVAIDVDLGRGGDILGVNEDAAVCIASALQLRGLGGLIVIDFLKMKDAAHQQKVLAKLRDAVRQDTEVTGVSGFSRNGLVEIVRRRKRSSLMRTSCRLDQRMTPETLALSALADAVKQGGASITIRATRDVALALTGALKDTLDETKRVLAVDIQVVTISDVAEDRYEIITGDV